MARVHKVASSKVAHRCHQGHDIQPPEGYSWAAPGFRARKKFACAKHPFRPSQLTTSAISSVLAAQEALEDQLDQINLSDDTDHEDLTTIWQEFADAVREYADEKRAAADAWENGNSQFEEVADAADSASSQAEDLEIPEFEPEDADSLDEESLAEERETWLGEQIDAMRSTADEVVSELGS